MNRYAGIFDYPVYRYLFICFKKLNYDRGNASASGVGAVCE